MEIAFFECLHCRITATNISHFEQILYCYRFYFTVISKILCSLLHQIIFAEKMCVLFQLDERHSFIFGKVGLQYTKCCTYYICRQYI